MRFLPNRPKVVEKAEKHSREYRKLISGGVAGFAGISVVQLLGVGHLDPSLIVAVSAFAISLPLLVKDLLDAQAEERHEITVNADKQLTITTFGLTLAMIGVGGIFWHFASWLGLLFAVVSFGSAWAHSSYVSALSDESRRKDD